MFFAFSQAALDKMTKYPDRIVSWNNNSMMDRQLGAEIFRNRYFGCSTVCCPFHRKDKSVDGSNRHRWISDRFWKLECHASKAECLRTVIFDFPEEPKFLPISPTDKRHCSRIGT